MINYISLSKKLKAMGHPPVEWLPKAYQPISMGGDGRTKHEDWVILKNTPRIDTAYPVPLPFRLKAGNGKPVLMSVANDDYPIVPGTEIVMKEAWDSKLGCNRVMRHVMTMMSVHPLEVGGPRVVWSRQEAFIGGEWTECFFTMSANIFGSKWLWYGPGLKVDEDGPMVWNWETSASIKWNHLG